jgi:6-aminohexanoate-oligomer endohydrolase
MFRSDRILTSGGLVSQGSPGAQPWSCGSSNSRSLTFDLPEVRIGIAECNEGPTGITVFLFPERVSGVVDTRGGAPGSSLTEALNASFGKYINAIAFCGGSAYGLEAASGVAAGLLHSGFASQRWGGVAIVPAAVVFDFKGRQNAVYPDKELGLKALEAARDSWFPLGAHGVGSFVHCGSYFGESFMERSGQGAAFQKLESTRLAVFTVVNARGAMVDRAGRVVLGNRDPRTGLRSSIPQDLSEGKQAANPNQLACSLTDNTTLTLVITNRVLDPGQLRRLAIETHASMARAIQPFHTSRDGDTLFAVTTATCDVDDPSLADLAVYTSELAWDAVLSCIPSAAEVEMKH